MTRQLAPLLLLLLCGCDSSPNEELRHPTPENLPDEAESVLSRTSEFTTPDLRQLGDRLRGRQLLNRIGSLDGPEHTVFGSIETIAADSSRAYVLDDRLNRVIAYTAAGNFVTAFGREGSGPLEFRSPEDLEIAHGDSLILSTRRGLKIFRLGDAEGELEVELAGTIDMAQMSNVSPRDICYLRSVDQGDLVIRNGNSSVSGLLHKVRLPVAAVEHSFGYRYASDNELVTSRFTDGTLSCSPADQVVLAGWQDLPFLRAYSYDGKVKWTTKLADFDPIPVVEFTTPDGAPAVRTELGAGGNVLLGVTSLDEGFVVQIGNVLPENEATRRGQMSGIDTYLVDASTGQGAFVGDDLPMIFAAVGDRLYAAGGEEYPVFMIFRF